MKKEKLVNGCLNYTGGKYKLLPQILPLFPTEINTFVDLMCGGLSVALNVEANKKICNDLESHVIDLYKNLLQLSSEEAMEKVLEVVERYDLSKTNQEGFVACRKAYNQNKTWEKFYATVTHAFNYQIRFNGKGEYNMPFGKDRSSFNKNLQNKFKNFVDTLETGVYTFSNLDFREFDFSNLNHEADFVYLDPPYLITQATYNEKGGWNEDTEKEFLQMLDRLNEQGVRFALSNVLTHKGKTNEILKRWCEDNQNKYIVHRLDYTYSNCNYHDKTGNEGQSEEVLICNYDTPYSMQTISNS